MNGEKMANITAWVVIKNEWGNIRFKLPLEGTGGRYRVMRPKVRNDQAMALGILNDEGERHSCFLKQAGPTGYSDIYFPNYKDASWRTDLRSIDIFVGAPVRLLDEEDTPIQGATVVEITQIS